MYSLHLRKYSLVLTIAGLFLGGCAANKTASSTDGANDDRITIKSADEEGTDATGVSATDNNSLALVDYLRRLPGLQIEQRGSVVNVMIRGVGSLSNNDPLFVVNNSPVGNSYADAVNSVDVNDIRNVNVMKGAEGQQMYGMRGANGVIQIFTKKK